ncbi:hypothetical protein [Saccharopolyspora shandongensis]|uniref:hypothetical protein n=1 Tax=Saccharopolyspora shandongensis TaxID=418495 RepID=UPI0033D77F92
MAEAADHYLWLVQLDIPEELEAEFNHIYDTEHAPAIAKVPGVIEVQRYVLETPVAGMQKYATTYRVTSPDLPQTPAWTAASAKGQWKTKISPHVVNARLSMFRAMP